MAIPPSDRMRSDVCTTDSLVNIDPGPLAQPLLCTLSVYDQGPCQGFLVEARRYGADSRQYTALPRPTGCISLTIMNTPPQDLV
jgi:hypothetical protein